MVVFAGVVYLPKPGDADQCGGKDRHLTSNLGADAETMAMLLRILPVMLNDFTGADKVYIACGCTNLRRGINGLASIVRQQFQLDLFTNTLFLSCGRRWGRIEVRCWEGDGFVLLYKRLESGSFQWLRNEAEPRLLTPQQYRWFMEGLNVEQSKANRYFV